MAMYKSDQIFKAGPKKRTSVGDGLRKRGSFSNKRKKAYRGQGK